MSLTAYLPTAADRRIDGLVQGGTVSKIGSAKNRVRVIFQIIDSGPVFY